jgi:hypothetical protein
LKNGIFILEKKNFVKSPALSAAQAALMSRKVRKIFKAKKLTF